jgi:hypothetical protein
MKLIRREPLNPCIPQKILPAAKDDASKVVPMEITYYGLAQLDLGNSIEAAKGGECAEVANVAPPRVTATVDLMNSSKMHLEFVSLVPGATASAQTLDADFSLGLDGKLNIKATPKCEYHQLPRTQ